MQISYIKFMLIKIYFNLLWVMKIKKVMKNMKMKKNKIMNKIINNKNRINKTINKIINKNNNKIMMIMMM